MSPHSIQFKSGQIQKLLASLSDSHASFRGDAAIILAAGHGKRIKSNLSKMLHPIWGQPTVLRVMDAARVGLKDPVVIATVGTKADQVASAIGQRKNLIYAHQETPNGTGHAAKVALKKLPASYNGCVFVFPGDMGLLKDLGVRKFRQHFIRSGADMAVLTGQYTGPAKENQYGRIIRIPKTDAKGRSTGQWADQVLAIIEAGDVQALKGPLRLKFRDFTFQFTQAELLRIREFNAGVYGFRAKELRRHMREIKSNNVQGEEYLTDIVDIFNRHGLKISACRAEDKYEIIGFNDKSVWHFMDEYYRSQVYQLLKNIVNFDSPDDFYLADEVVKDLLRMDKAGKSVDINIGTGVYVGAGVKLNTGVTLQSYAHLEGNIRLGENVTIWRNAIISTYPHQTLRIGSGSEIFWRDIVKGNTSIGRNCKIESSVNVTGSDEYPTSIGDNVTIKGTSYVFGSQIDPGLFIEHCVLKHKRIKRRLRDDGTVQPVRYIIPQPEGVDSVEPIERNQK